jgi:esterase/lipase
MQVLILHGWPQFEIGNYFLTKYFEDKGFITYTPNLFIDKEIFSAQNILNKILSISGGKNIDLIVGISLGGLVEPFIAKEYPKAKLIFISSGPYLKSKTKTFNYLISFANSKIGSSVLPLMIKMPNLFFRLLFKLANPFKGDKKNKKIYEKDMVSNIESIKRIPIKKEIEILKFVNETNNSDLLKKLTNKSLIFNGENDVLMGKNRGKKLNQLLHNSKLLVTDGSHFDSFTYDNLKQIDSFLN